MQPRVPRVSAPSGHAIRASLAGIVAVVGVALAPVAAADAVRFPLTLDYQTLQLAMRKHLRDESGGELVLWRTDDGCGTFTLREPTVSAAAGRLRIAGPGAARAAIPFLGWCWAEASWDGPVAILARPELGPDWKLRLRDLDTRLGEAEGSGGVARRVAAVVARWAEREVADFAFDLGPPVQEVRALLGSFAATAQAAPLLAALQTLRPVAVTVEPDGVKVDLSIDLPSAPAAPRAPEAALTPDELKRWEARLESWDGFLVFLVKNLGVLETDAEAQDELLDVLLSARHELTDVLGRGPEAGVDPVRQLFLNTWSRVRAIVRRAALRSSDETRALRYVTFLTAGDALAALEAAAPAAGLEISADGLRRLARVLDPAYAGDPVEYSDLPDSTLRQLFKFRDPDAPPRRSRRRAPGSWDWIGPRAAHAAEADAEWVALGHRLAGWVPDNREVRAYRDTVARLLEVAVERTVDPDRLDPRFERLFEHLVKAVAWQESCWRQFVRSGGRVTYITSRTGDVGMMQINVRVWRGFFDPQKLRWNAAYNAGAGAEILWHLLTRYGVREARAGFDNAPRATFAAYNGGPSRHRRYRLATTPPRIRAIDHAFWEKYRAVAAGDAEDRVLCLPPGATS